MRYQLRALEHVPVRFAEHGQYITQNLLKGVGVIYEITQEAREGSIFYKWAKISPVHNSFITWVDYKTSEEAIEAANKHYYQSLSRYIEEIK